MSEVEQIQILPNQVELNPYNLGYEFEDYDLISMPHMTILNDVPDMEITNSELGARLQNNVASRACVSFSNCVGSRAIAYFSTPKIRIISLSRHCVSRQ